jgi:hypothetical protein
MVAPLGDKGPGARSQHEETQRRVVLHRNRARNDLDEGAHMKVPPHEYADAYKRDGRKYGEGNHIPKWPNSRSCCIHLVCLTRFWNQH